MLIKKKLTLSKINSTMGRIANRIVSDLFLDIYRAFHRYYLASSLILTGHCLAIEAVGVDFPFGFCWPKI